MAKRKRFETDFFVNRLDADEFVSFIIQDFFYKEGFTYMEYKDEYVCKKEMVGQPSLILLKSTTQTDMSILKHG